ncbi:MAG: hypothetical protein U0599_15785 [Vicinamibacteria bacterium]
MALSRRWYRPATPPKSTPDGRAMQRWDAGRYIGCPSCGRLLRIEWAVRSLVCSCGSRVPVGPSGESGA